MLLIHVFIQRSNSFGTSPFDKTTALRLPEYIFCVLRALAILGSTNLSKNAYKNILSSINYNQKLVKNLIIFSQEIVFL